MITTSTRIGRGDEPTLCNGLTLAMGARLSAADQISLRLTIENHSRFPWQGTIRLLLGGASIPIDLGRVPANGSESETVSFDLEPGTHQLTGTLLIGP